MRSRLSNKLVQMLLYCYINLRLINQVSEDLSDFLTSAIANVGEEQDEEHVDFEEDDVNDPNNGEEAEEVIDVSDDECISRNLQRLHTK